MGCLFSQGDPHFHEDFRDPGSPLYQYNRDPGPYFTVRMGTRGPHFTLTPAPEVAWYRATARALARACTQLVLRPGCFEMSSLLGSLPLCLWRYSSVRE